MQTIWAKIETWLEENAPSVLRTLQLGAKEEEIQRVEAALGVELPEDVKASYRIHDGQLGFGLFEGQEFLSLARMLDEWKVWQSLLEGNDFAGLTSDPEPGIRADWWNAKWIPLTYDGAGNHYCLDLDPDEGGDYGQIITLWHDDSLREKVASSFEEWLEAYAQGLESGKYVYNEDYEAIVRIDDL